MAINDVKYDYTPVNAYATRGRGASVTALRSALTTYNATSYTSARLDTMTKLDMTYACKVHGLSVSGI